MRSEVTHSSNQKRVALLDDLVSANHILYDHGIVDGFGHVSVRHPERSDRFWLSASVAPGLVSPNDILTYDLHGQPIDAGDRKSYLERFIHSEIYGRRPDAMAVVHSHAATVLPFTVSTVRLRPICHMAGFLREVPRHDLRTATGRMTDLLVRDGTMGCGLAVQLGDNAVVLMRGHGFAAVGESLQEAVFRSIYTEHSARLQQNTIALGGDIVYLDDEEAVLAERANAGQYERPWRLWKRESEVTASSVTRLTRLTCRSDMRPHNGKRRRFPIKLANTGPVA